MESWQRDYIRKIKPKLLEYTWCNSMLLHQLKAANVFSDIDIAEIESKSNKYKEASCFYDIVETRANSYVELLKALAECKQNGAVDLLMAGLPTDLLLQLKVRFLGRDNHLSELFDQKDISELNEKLKSLNLNKYITLLLECTSEVISLLKNTIPNLEKYYIPRELVRRRNLNKKMFTTDCKDVFVFTNYSRAQLSHLAAATNCHTASSRDQIQVLTARFILLEDVSHWKDICDIAYGLPVHLITYEGDKYILTKTTGGSRVLNQFLDYKSEGAQDYISENDVESLEREISLCICDLPGMGKSLLLANLARTFSKCNPHIITALISLPMVAQCLKSHTDMQVIEFSMAMRVLCQVLGQNEISGHILFLLLKKRTNRIHIYLDGLDEVPYEYLAVVKKFMKSLKEEEKWIRMHVTARTHMRHELEAALGVIPYDIVPFTHDNKIQFLTDFWKNQDPTSNETRLAEFANYCLDKWKEHMTEESVQITGIPLQCRLLAEVYSRQAHRYARESVQLNETEITETSLLQLYNSYLQIGLARVENHIISSTTTQSQPVTDMLSIVEQFHIWQALKLLYPEIADLYATYYVAKTVLEVGEVDMIMGMGFLLPDFCQGDFSVKFVHRTFAEFLTARFFASILRKNQSGKHLGKTIIKFEKQTLEYFFQEVAHHKITRFVDFDLYSSAKFTTGVHQFSSYVVMKFVNDELHNISSFNSLLPVAFSNAISGENCYGMIISTLAQKLTVILRVVKCALGGLSKFKLWRYRRYLSWYCKGIWSHSRQLNLLYITAQLANDAVARELYDILSQILQLDLYGLHNDRPNDRRTPLHIAVRRGHYEVFEHVLQYSTWRNDMELLIYMTKSSCHDHALVVQNKTEIFHLLSSRNPSAICQLNRSKFFETLLVRLTFVHPCLIKLLIQNGLYISHKNRQIFLNIAAGSWKADELYDMLTFFDSYVNNETTLQGIDFPLFDVVKYSASANKLFSINPSIQWDAEDDYGNTLIHMSIAGQAGLCMIQKCLENGANLDAKNQFGWTCMHVAAAKRNVEVMYYLLDNGVSTTEKTNAGDTPLHLFFLNLTHVHRFLASMNLVNISYNKWQRITVKSSSLNEVVTKIITSQQNEHVLQLLTEKNKKGQTILHNFLSDNRKGLKMSCETLTIMMDSLHIKVNETDNEGKNLLDAALQGRQNESIIKLLRQKLADV